MIEIAYSVLGLIAGFGVAVFLRRGTAASGRDERVKLERALQEATARAKKLQRAADERKAALEQAATAQSAEEAARDNAALARAEQEALAQQLASLQARHEKAVADFRSEIAEREMRLARLEQRDQAEDKARAAARDRATVGDRTGVGSRRAPDVGNPVGTDASVNSDGSAGYEKRDGNQPSARTTPTDLDARMGELEQQLQKERKTRIAVEKEREASRQASKRLQERLHELGRTQKMLDARFAERNRRVAELEARVAELEADAARVNGARVQGVAGLDPELLDETAANRKLIAAYRYDMATKQREIESLRDRVRATERRLERARKKAKRSRGDGAPISSFGAVDELASPVAAAASGPVGTADGIAAGGADGRAADPEPARDDLTQIAGIGPVYAGRLAAAGITSFRHLAERTPDELAAALDLGAGRGTDLEDWLKQARTRLLD